MDSRALEVQTYLEEKGLLPQNFEQPTPTSIAAADAIGCTVGEIAKSILMLVGKHPVMVVTSGDTRINSSRLKRACGFTGKVKLPAADEVLIYSGYMPGGVSPFLLPEELPVYIDCSLQRFNVVYPAAATNSSGVAITISKLMEICSGTIVDVCDVREAHE